MDETFQGGKASWSQAGAVHGGIPGSHTQKCLSRGDIINGGDPRGGDGGMSGDWVRNPGPDASPAAVLCGQGAADKLLVVQGLGVAAPYHVHPGLVQHPHLANVLFYIRAHDGYSQLYSHFRSLPSGPQADVEHGCLTAARQ